jgi:hypothetical protein
MAIHFDTNGDLEIVISFIDITERKLMEIVEGRRSKQNSNKAKLIFWLI